jgi:hypothetical protein
VSTAGLTKLPGSVSLYNLDTSSSNVKRTPLSLQIFCGNPNVLTINSPPKQDSFANITDFFLASSMHCRKFHHQFDTEVVSTKYDHGKETYQ